MTWSRNRQNEVIRVATPEPPMRAGLLALLLVLPCAAGCGPIGGVEPGDGSGGSAGSAGAAGMSGSAGSSGAAGSGGAAGSAGSGGVGGSVMQGGDVGAITVEGVAPFRGAAKGAYTIMHDD